MKYHTSNIPYGEFKMESDSTARLLERKETKYSILQINAPLPTLYQKKYIVLNTLTLQQAQKIHELAHLKL